MLKCLNFESFLLVPRQDLWQKPHQELGKVSPRIGLQLKLALVLQLLEHWSEGRLLLFLFVSLSALRLHLYHGT